MSWVKQLTAWVIRMSETKYGPLILFVASFTESLLSVVPFTFLFMVLAVASPRKSFRFALICITGATIGAALAYGIGYFSWVQSDGGFTSVAHFFFNYIPGFTIAKYYHIQAWVQHWGLYALLMVGFTPLPFELVTISSGVFQMPFLLYLMATIAGRSLRYFLMAFLFWKFGPSIRDNFEKNIKILAIGFTFIFVVALLLLKMV